MTCLCRLTSGERCACCESSRDETKPRALGVSADLSPSVNTKCRDLPSPLPLMCFIALRAVCVCAGHRTNTTRIQTNRAYGAFSKVSESSAPSQNTVECTITKCWTKRRTTKWFIRNQRCTIGPGKMQLGCDFSFKNESSVIIPGSMGSDVVWTPAFFKISLFHRRKKSIQVGNDMRMSK